MKNYITSATLTDPTGIPVKVFFDAKNRVMTNLFSSEYTLFDNPEFASEIAKARELTGTKRDDLLTAIREKYSHLASPATVPTSDPLPSAQEVLQEIAKVSPAPKTQTIERRPPREQKKFVNPAMTATIEKIMNFFSEFSLSVSARFLNTLARCENASKAIEYTQNYADLINIGDSNAIREKAKCAEYRMLCSEIIDYHIEKKVNNRFVVFYGDAGTGKTTTAIEQYPDAQIIACNASILPDELMRTFDFNDSNGNPVFRPSALRLAMEAGKPIVFDEINLLSFDCLRMLQILLDGKEYFSYNGDRITIKDGFKIIGTMNLTVNDQTFSLPEPLVDRAEEIRHFTLTAKQLAEYIS